MLPVVVVMILMPSTDIQLFATCGKNAFRNMITDNSGHFIARVGDKPFFYWHTFQSITWRWCTHLLIIVAQYPRLHVLFHFPSVYWCRVQNIQQSVILLPKWIATLSNTVGYYPGSLSREFVPKKQCIADDVSLKPMAAQLCLHWLKGLHNRHIATAKHIPENLLCYGTSDAN